MPRPAVLVMARAPRPGAVKTRLEPMLGPEGCARLARALIARAGGWAARGGEPGLGGPPCARGGRWPAGGGEPWLAYPPSDADAHDEVAALAPPGARLLAQ